MTDHCLHTFANGLRLVTVEMPHLHSVECFCYVGVGGRYESAATAGVSHFLEHMLFRGTADYPSSFELERAFEAIGGSVNAFTDAETSSYHSCIHPDRLKEGVALFASMLLRPLFRDLETERRIILEEALDDLNEQGEEINPDNLAARLLWPGHPLGLPTIGSRETIQAIDLEALKAHFATFYVPANTVIAVTGRVRHAEALEAVEESFGSWRGAGEWPVPLAAATAPGPGSLWVRDSDSQIGVQLAFPLPGRHSPQTFPLRLLRRLLSWGGTSRLMLQLRERLGLTYHVEANLSFFEECGCFSIDLSLNPANLVPAVRELLAVLEEVRSRPPAGEELDRVVQTYLYDLDFSRDHTDDMAMRYGWGELVGYVRSPEEDRRDICAVTPERLHAAAQQYLSPRHLQAVIVGPWRQRDRAEVERLLAAYM